MVGNATRRGCLNSKPVETTRARHLSRAPRGLREAARRLRPCRVTMASTGIGERGTVGGTFRFSRVDVSPPEMICIARPETRRSSPVAGARSRFLKAIVKRERVAAGYSNRSPPHSAAYPELTDVSSGRRPFRSTGLAVGAICRRCRRLSGHVAERWPSAVPYSVDLATARRGMERAVANRDHRRNGVQLYEDRSAVEIQMLDNSGMWRAPAGSSSPCVRQHRRAMRALRSDVAA